MNYDHPVARETTRSFDPTAPRHIVDDAFELEFNKATIDNPENKNKYRLSGDDRAQIMWYLSISHKQYLSEYHALPNKEAKMKAVWMYQKSTKEFFISGPFPGTSLMR